MSYRLLKSAKTSFTVTVSAPVTDVQYRRPSSCAAVPTVSPVHCLPARKLGRNAASDTMLFGTHA